MKTVIPLAIMAIFGPMTAFATCNYPCEIDNPDESQRWAIPCVDLPDGRQVNKDGVAGRCCGGEWYENDPAKEESEGWEWDAAKCAYVSTECLYVDGPEYACGPEPYECHAQFCQDNEIDYADWCLQGLGVYYVHCLYGGMADVMKVDRAYIRPSSGEDPCPDDGPIIVGYVFTEEVEVFLYYEFGHCLDVGDDGYFV